MTLQRLMAAPANVDRQLILQILTSSNPATRNFQDNNINHNIQQLFKQNNNSKELVTLKMKYNKLLTKLIRMPPRNIRRPMQWA